MLVMFFRLNRRVDWSTVILQQSNPKYIIRPVTAAKILNLTIASYINLWYLEGTEIDQSFSVLSWKNMTKGGRAVH